MERETGATPKEINFYYVRHTIEEADFVWGEIKDADIYFIEAVGLTTNERSSLTEHILRLAKNKSRILSGLGKAHFFQQLGESEPFAVALLSKMIDDKKSVYFIDGGPNDPGFREDDTALKMFDYASALVVLGDLKKAWEIFLTQAVVSSKAMNLCNNFVLTQIDSLLKDLPDLEGKKIAVIQGAAHSMVYNTFRKNYPKMETKKRFLVPGAKHFSFPLALEFDRRLQIGQPSHIQEEVLQRDFIANFALFEEIREAVPGISIINTVELSSKISRRIPREEMESLFEELKSLDAAAKAMDEKTRGEFVRREMSEIGKSILKSYASNIFGL